MGARRGAAARGRHGEGAARDAGDGGRRDARGKPVQPRARRRPGDPRRGGAHHGARARRDEGARREVAGGLPRRGAARHDEERARHAAGSEAQVVAGAGRCVRARGRRLRLARCARHRGPDRSRRSTRSATPTRGCGSSSSTRSSQANPFDVPPSWVNADDRRLHAGVQDSGRAARRVRRGVRLGRGAAGAARHDHRRDRRAAAARGDREGRRRPRRDGRRAARQPIRASSMRHCRRREDSRRSSAASRKRRCSSG